MASQAIGFGPEETYVPSLDGPEQEAAGGDAPDTEGLSQEQELEPEQEVGSEEADEEPAALTVEGDDYDEGQARYTGNAKLDALIDHFAKEAHLNLKNKEDFRTAKRLADKELYIIKLREENATLKGGKKPAAGAGSEEVAADGLTAFERSLLTEGSEDAGAGKKPDAAAAPEKPGQQVERKPYNDNREWKNPQDAYADLSKAWANAGERAEKGDMGGLKEVAEIEADLWERRFTDIAVPMLSEALPALVERRLEQLIQQKYGDVFPEAKKVAEREHLEEARDFALTQLSETKGFEDIASLTEEEEGPPVLFGKNKFPNTPLNRILAEAPGLLNIQVSHKNPQTAQRLTMIERLKVAHRIWKKGNLGAAKAREAVKAGAKLGQRNSQESTRQGLNRGKGTAGLGSGKPGAGSYVSDIMSAGSDGERSFASL